MSSSLNSTAYCRQTSAATSAILDSTTTVNNQSRHFLRSRSPSPSQPAYHSARAYAAFGATEHDAVIGATSSKSSLSSAHSTTRAPIKYISPFISTKSRPSLYQRAISDSSAGKRGRSRSRSTAGSSAPVVSTPSYAGAMIPPFACYQLPTDEERRRNSNASSRSRSSSRASTTHSSTTSNPSGKRSFVAKLKSVLKGGETTETNFIYLTQEEAGERDLQIKKGFNGPSIATPRQH